MLEAFGYFLRLPGFLFGSLCNIIFSFFSSIFGNFFGIAAYIFAVASTPFVFLVNAYTNDRASWEKHLEEIAEPKLYRSSFDGRQAALARWLNGKGGYTGGANEADIGCVTWVVGIPLGILLAWAAW